jgi:hypothetical protein
MNEQYNGELISAALDGEPASVDDLRRALQAPEGRDALASFLLLRVMAAADDAGLDGDSADVRVTSAGEGASRQRPRPVSWRARGPRVPASIAASLAVLAMAASFWAGTALRPQPATGTPRAGVAADVGRPPAVVDDRSRASGAPKVGQARPEPVAAQTSSPTPAKPPRPTRVLKFEVGVDWRSGS